MPLRSQGHCGVGRGLSELHWVWCNGRGPHDKLRQEPQGSSPGFECAGFDSDRRVPAELGQESQASSCVEELNSACLSSCSRGDIPLVELCVEPVGFSGRCTGVLVTLLLYLHPQGCLRSGVRASGSYPERTAQSGSFGMWHHPRGYVSNFLLRKASSLGAPGWAGTPSRQSRGIYPPVVIRRGESHQMKWCRELRCSPR